MKHRFAAAHWALFAYALALLVVQPLGLDSFFTPTWPAGLAKDAAMVYCLAAGLAMLAGLAAAYYRHYLAAKRVTVCSCAAMILLVLYNLYRLILLRMPFGAMALQVAHLVALAVLTLWVAQACDSKAKQSSI